MRRRTDTVPMEPNSELIEAIEAILEFVSKNTMGDYIKRDEINDQLLDLRQKVAATN